MEAPGPPQGVSAPLPKPSRIQKLDERVVNRIAAGEVVQRPSNAVKELLENSLDAGATNVQILAKDGGLKILQITDNGCGIPKEDLPLACERFATSKLRRYEDLESISTYGFRGEALASISHVAHVTITTKTANSNCAWKASYADGKLVGQRPGASAEPRPCAGNDGTQILVEDLFFNMPMRLKAIRNVSEEYSRILDVVSRYAVHNAGRVAISCKKAGSAEADVATIAGASKVDNIRSVFGSSVARELLEVGFSSPEWDVQCTGYVSNPNFNMKKMTFVLFINGRLVESSSLKRAIEGVYSTFLPKNAHPFVYLSLDIDPRNVDVNVHPTKREVQFLHEEEVIGLLVDEIGQKLASASASRTYTTQAFAPLTREDGDAPELTRASKIRRVAESPESDDDDDDRESQTGSRATKSAPAKALHLQTQLTAHFPGWSDAVTPESGGGRAASGGGGSSKPKLPPSKLVRVDSKARKIDSFLFRQNASEDKQSMTSAPSKPKKNPNVEEGGMEEERESIDEDLPAEEGDDMDAADSRSPEPLVVEDGDEDLPDKAARVATSIGPGSQEQSDLMVEEQVEAEGDTEKLPEENATATKSATADSRAPRPFVEVQLTSVLELRQSITDKMHRGITEIFRGHTFVGVVDSRLALLQHQIRLYMVNYREASRLLFEQLALKVFANFGRIHLDPPIPLLDAVLIAMDDERDEDGALSSGQAIVDLLLERRDMLDEYFSLHIDPAGQLHTLPLLLNAYSPNLEKLPDFLLRLGTHVNWTEEKSCFADLAREIGLFYAVEPVAGDAIDADHVKPAPNAKHLDIVEHVLFPAFKEHLCVPQKWATTGDIGRIGWGGDCGLRLTGAKS